MVTGNAIMTTRRVVLLGGVATLAGGGVFYIRTRDVFDGIALDPVVAHQRATAGEILLVDIRRPDEWAKTGVGEGAVPLDMRRDDFITELDKLVSGDKARPVALICARGVRSDRMSARLTEAGFSRIIDVPEGMLGSRAGPGWLARNLPVNKG